MATNWTVDKILEVATGYRKASVLAAAVELELFDAMLGRRRTAAQIAQSIKCDRRAVTVILDALAALKLIEKSGGRYAVPADVVPFLTAKGKNSVLAMSQHHACCLRRWAQLAAVAKSGRPAVRVPSA
mgnify:FL=1